ncbi:WecB/TagA/CpsF family glycosyltransferase [Pediococcus claussenii]|uniref:N-acetylglucosaminyldiphosphoundecaprenol N-acetyl-beta-D-mannosaminyltransferase n=1 Tax=Pediococcus claussenii (strain ATCC BAA-344 / DSM 14800 / JCM 18046 / KCTC 3811 / LMG 21948 / P06) TaxID=701521 RepID=G8PAS0_PEDCP|nr:WecB/TagA/CpsF family glycosyltransferase [Pediococcus claussenii]AEV94629.1 glycosyl transferase, WecB/TagA/CpsF family protein [Pediococcus claussenii ATCC BAA-344]ANZ69833.1 acetylglucosaminyldiphospho-UDP acetyl-beta-D-mannosaminyltransferase [Pediococcus claussenii]ANZ71650.1 acetylglucosaminyldiphospho-UDP acetyl-beta-D-mannosaminyltransferase [Pediococcus claussenii]
MTFKTINILNVSFINTSATSFWKQLETDISAHKNRFVVTANPEIVMYARRNPKYHTILQQADYITPDGIGIVRATRKLSSPIPERITGYETFLELLRWGNDQGSRVYIVGSKPEVITKVATKIKSEYPNINLVGYHDGYFSNPKPILKAIQRQKPDMVFVATGFPKQEQFIAEYRHINDGLWMGIGGSFDVFSGTVKRAPLFWQNHHLEWLYRLITDPKRLKRQLVIPQFMWLMMWHQPK